MFRALLLIGPEGLDEVGVAGDIFKTVEGGRTAFIGAAFDVMIGARVAVDAEGFDEVAVARNVIEPVERRRAALVCAVLDEMGCPSSSTACSEAAFLNALSRSE